LKPHQKPLGDFALSLVDGLCHSSIALFMPLPCPQRGATLVAMGLWFAEDAGATSLLSVEVQNACNDRIKFMRRKVLSTTASGTTEALHRRLLRGQQLLSLYGN